MDTELSKGYIVRWENGKSVSGNRDEGGTSASIFQETFMKSYYVKSYIMAGIFRDEESKIQPPGNSCTTEERWWNKEVYFSVLVVFGNFHFLKQFLNYFNP